MSGTQSKRARNAFFCANTVSPSNSSTWVEFHGELRAQRQRFDDGVFEFCFEFLMGSIKLGTVEFFGIAYYKS